MSGTGIEDRLYGGRTLVGYTDSGEFVAGWPGVAHEAIRAINHLTSQGPIPAPTVYRILGELKCVGKLLPQALAQIARGLRASLDVLDVYDHRRDPAESVADAVILLNQALRKAAALGEVLEATQSAISEQGYHSAPVDDPDAAARPNHADSDSR